MENRPEARTGSTDFLNRAEAESRSGEGSGEPVIVADGLTKRFGRTNAVDGLSFEVGGGKVTGFLGPNGAGKTTTLRMILGLARPTMGEATILGRPYRHLDQPANRVGAVLETSSFHPARTARNHLRILAAAAEVPGERVDQVLAAVGLGGAADKRVGHYSMGMRQRLGLAGALLGAPELLVLDEPANGLDPGGIRWLRDFLRSFAARGGAVFVSSHILAEVSQLAHEVVVINRGRLVVQAPVHELTARASSVVRVRASEPERLGQVLVEAGLEARPSGPDEVTVKGTSAEQVGRIAAQAGLVIVGLEEEEQSLEEVFFELTDEEGIR
jgi:ABC-2 type transport system ATP-binding protein